MPVPNLIRYVAGDGVRTKVFSLNTQDTSQVASILLSMQLLASYAGITRVRQTAFLPVGGVATAPSAAGLNILDAARIVFETSTGKSVQLIFPAAPSDLYLADGKTVDPTTIASLIAACTVPGAALCTASNEAAVQYLAGYKIRVAADPYSKG